MHMWVCFLDGVQSLYKACGDAESSKEQEQLSDSEISALYCGRQVPAITTGAPRQDGEVLNTHANTDREYYKLTSAHTHAYMYLLFFRRLI